LCSSLAGPGYAGQYLAPEHTHSKPEAPLEFLESLAEGGSEFDVSSQPAVLALAYYLAHQVGMQVGDGAFSRTELNAARGHVSAIEQIAGRPVGDGAVVEPIYEYIQGSQLLRFPSVNRRLLADHLGGHGDPNAHDEVVRASLGDQEKTVFSVSFPGGEGPYPVAIVQHGFRDSKEASHIVHLGARLLAKGYIVVRVDFRDMYDEKLEHRQFVGHNLYNESSGDVDHREMRPAIKDKSFDDIAVALDWLSLDDHADFSHVVLAGHSHGGFIMRSILAERPEQIFKRHPNFNVRMIIDLSGGMHFGGHEFGDKYFAREALNKIPEHIRYVYTIGTSDEGALTGWGTQDPEMVQYNGVLVTDRIADFFEGLQERGVPPIIVQGLEHEYPFYKATGDKSAGVSWDDEMFRNRDDLFEQVLKEHLPPYRPGDGINYDGPIQAQSYTTQTFVSHPTSTERVEYRVNVPQKGDGPFPTALIMHGWKDSGKERFLKEMAQYLTEELDMITVLPDFRYMRDPSTG